MLSSIAQEIYGIANELERTKKLTGDLSKYGARGITSHLQFYGYAFEASR